MGPHEKNYRYIRIRLGIAYFLFSTFILVTLAVFKWMICDYNTFPTELLLLAIITITSSIAMYFRVKRWLDVLAGFIFDTAEFKIKFEQACYYADKHGRI